MALTPRILDHPEREPGGPFLLLCPGCTDQPLMARRVAGPRYVVEHPRAARTCVRCGTTVRPSDPHRWLDMEELLQARTRQA